MPDEATPLEPVVMLVELPWLAPELLATVPELLLALVAELLVIATELLDIMPDEPEELAEAETDDAEEVPLEPPPDADEAEDDGDPEEASEEPFGPELLPPELELADDEDELLELEPSGPQPNTAKVKITTKERVFICLLLLLVEHPFHANCEGAMGRNGAKLYL